jgi:hypothetical protein
VKTQLRRAAGLLLLRFGTRLRQRGRRLLLDPATRCRPTEVEWLIDVCKTAAALDAVARVAAENAVNAPCLRSKLLQHARRIVESIETVRRAEAGAEVRAADGKLLAFKQS